MRVDLLHEVFGGVDGRKGLEREEREAGDGERRRDGKDRGNGMEANGREGTRRQCKEDDEEGVEEGLGRAVSSYVHSCWSS